jgi:hypothetical protein
MTIRDPCRPGGLAAHGFTRRMHVRLLRKSC